MTDSSLLDGLDEADRDRVLAYVRHLSERRTGRPSLLTPELTAAIVARLDDDTPYELACRCEGVSSTTAWRWLAEGDTDEPQHEAKRVFRDTIERARARSEERLFREVRHGVNSWEGNDDWKARLAILERLYPERYAPTQTVLVKVEREVIADVLQRLRAGLDPDRYAEAAAVLAGGDDPGAGTGDTRH